MKKTNLLVTFVVIGVFLAGAAILYRSYLPFDWNGYGGYHMGGGMAGHWGMGLVMPFFWVLLIVGVVSLLNRPSNTREQNSLLPAGPDAVELLKQRYAKGEIDKTEFRMKLADIRDA